MIKTKKIDAEIDWNSTVCSIGSCFSEHLIKLLKSLGMETDSNPSGIIYNTDSIAKIFEKIEKTINFTEADFFCHQGLWKSWLHHGDFSRTELSEAINNANEKLEAFRQKTIKSDLFIITPSSSVVYYHNKEQTIVANCHRVPNSQFSRKLLSCEENFQNLQKTINSIRSINKTCQIIITLSPVRHYPGELTLNSRSKANLIEAIHKTVESNERCDYFPSYEILLDELRDYRFYKDDMLHPNELAQKIIFQHFIESTFSESAIDELPAKIKAAKKSQHRPRN